MAIASTEPAARSATRRRFAWLNWVGGIGFAAFLASQIFGIATSPPEIGMGHLQKIMYVHLPVVWNGFIAIFIVLVMSTVYLFTRREKHDLLAASAAEIGTVLIGLTLVVGSIWAKPTWGVWWTWDPRLTSTAVLFVIFVGYLALRAFTEDIDRRARWSAAVGILGALNVPIVYMSVRWWRTIHQVQSSPSTVDPSYVLSLRANAIAFLILLIYFIGRRYQAAVLERERERLAEEAALR
ncbi:MAG TPA: cytochrome c biogenesis protein CcsA [Longimicrobiales bacterium]|nr:cytochrome c biogenesis protein CcsA [Longimicrobiales bacterium]